MQTETKSIDLVMLVDDNDTDNFISKRIIEITKFAKRVEVKGSGKAALDYLRENQNSPENLPSLIFLDINMPIVDGFVFLYEFEKFNEVVRNKCKVIILSSSDNKRDIDKIVNNNHVIKFITKPLTEVALDEIKLNNIWISLEGFLTYFYQKSEQDYEKTPRDAHHEPAMLFYILRSSGTVRQTRHVITLEEKTHFQF